MIKKISKKFLIILITLFLLLSVFITSSNAASGEILLDNFDTYGVPTSTGSTAYGTWESTLGVTSTDYDYSLPNSFKFKPGNADYKFWYNLTTISISGFQFEMYSDTLPAAACDMYIELLNGTNTLIKWKFDFRNTNQDVYVYDYGSSSYKALTTAGTDWYQKHVKFGFKSNYTAGVNPLNSVYYYLLNSTNSTLKSCEWQWNGIDEFDIQDITQIYIYTTGTSATYTYFDDFIFFSESGSSGGSSYYDMSSYNKYCGGSSGSYAQIPYGNKYIEIDFKNPVTYNTNITGVDLGLSIDQWNQVSSSLSDYSLKINGLNKGNPTVSLPDPNNPYQIIIRWYFPSFPVSLESGEYPLLEFRCNAFVTYSGKNYYWYGVNAGNNLPNIISYYHNNDGFFDGIADGTIYTLDFYPCFYYESNNQSMVKPSIPAVDLIDYKTIYGNPAYNYSFIEFQDNENPCKYHVGDNPRIMYYLTNEYYGEDSFYTYRIKKTLSNQIIYNDIITIPESSNNISAYYTIPDVVFPSEGSYYIILYSTDGYGAEINETICISNIPVVVCPDNTPSGGLSDLDFSSIPIVFKVLISIVIIIVLTMTPYLLAVMISKTNIEVKIPELVYVSFFFFGMIISIVLGFLDAWVIFVVLLGIILTFAVFWIKGKEVG